MAFGFELKQPGGCAMAVPVKDNRLFRFDSKTPQRLVGAAALLIAAVTLWHILWPLRYSLLATWVVIEVIFYVLYWRPRYVGDTGVGNRVAGALAVRASILHADVAAQSSQSPSPLLLQVQ